MTEKPRAVGNMHFFVHCQIDAVNKKIVLVEISRYQKHQ